MTSTGRAATTARRLVAPRSVAASVLLAWLVTASAAGTAAAERVIRIDPEFLREPTASATGSGRFSGGLESGYLRDMALEWRKRVQEGNTAIAEELLPDIGRLLEEPGYHARRTLIGAFVAMGRDWALLEDWSRAEQAYEAALALEPGDSSAHLGLGDLASERDGGLTGLVGLLGGVLRSSLSGLGQLVGFLRIAANFVLVLLAAAAVTVAALSLVLMAKYNRLLRHGVREHLAERVPEGLDGVLAWVVVLVPILLFLSPPWWVAYWLVVFRPHGTRAERRLCIIGLAVMALLPSAFHGVTRLSAMQHDPVLRAVDGVRERDVSPAVVQGLEEFATRIRRPEAQFLLASALAAAGRPDDAVVVYGEAIDLDRDLARAFVNRGNIHFMRGDRGSAISDYNRAVDEDRTLAVGWRNGSIAYAQDLKTDEATQWLRKAQELAGGQVARWNEDIGPDAMIDSVLSSGELLSLLVAGQPPLVPGLLRSLLTPPAIAGVLGLLVSLGFGASLLERFAASACEKCGRAFCGRCHAAAKTSAYCTQCVHLYVKKDGVSPVVRSAKLREVNRWVAINSLATRFFNILLPGAGSLYADRVLAGMSLVFLWAVAITALLLPAHLLRAADRIGQEDLTTLFAAELLLLIVVYVVALVQSLRHAD